MLRVSTESPLLSLREVEVSPLLYSATMKPAILSFDPAWFDEEADMNWLTEAIELEEDEVILQEDEDYDEGFHEPIWVCDIGDFGTLDPNLAMRLFPHAMQDPIEFPAEDALPEIDLLCDEDMPVSEAFDEEDSELLCWAELPGVSCTACRYERDRQDDPDVLCQLCYIRLHEQAEFGKFIKI